jgi:pimeloyl-ACP methyl ester carboxylesterase
MEIYEAGSGPAVVLLHGTPSPVTYFAPVIEALAPTRRVLCPVLPGYAGSAPHAGGYGLWEIARLFADELASRGVHEAAVLGYSYGAYRAIAMALAGSLKVTRLHLLSGFAGFDEPACVERQQMAAALRARAFDLHPVFVQMVLPPAYAAANPAVAAEIAGWIELASPDVLADEVDASTIDDLRPRLHELDIPVLARVGELDPSATPAMSRAMIERVRGGVLEIAPGGGHALLIEDRAETTASVVRFFTGG